MPAKPKRLLIVDDDPIALRLLRAMVESLGHQVVATAGNGHEAVAKTTETGPGMVIMDLSMPGMDGIEATRRIYAARPTPVVMLTALDDFNLVEQASEAGVGAYVIKPPRSPELSRAMVVAAARFADWMKLRQLNDELKKALAQVRRLRGLLPICAHCKRIRDDRGYWHAVEVYVQSHTDAEFTHGLCDRCASIYYPLPPIPAGGAIPAPGAAIANPPSGDEPAGDDSSVSPDSPASAPDPASGPTP